MCGIAGFLLHDSVHVSPVSSMKPDSPFDLNARENQAIRMIASIRHRGPDGLGLLIDPPLYMGHCRLAILDPTPDGHQPMCDLKERYWISYNGEVYNFPELKRELIQLGATFRTRTDTEVLLHAFLYWGRDMLARLDGMFAFTIWDRHKRSLWLARDGVGIKPLFYAANHDRFLFGSEIKAILAAGVSSEPDHEALGTFLSFGYVAAPATGFSGIRQLPPGHEMTVSFGERDPQPSRWFRMPYPNAPTTWSRWESADRLHNAFSESVNRQLRSDVPIGAFLSGGLDSSSVVACMTRLNPSPIQTYSIAMSDKDFDESEPAMAMATYARTIHHAPLVEASHFEDLVSAVYHAEDPIADNSMLPFWKLCETTSRNVKVALSGDGADELLGGYSTYRATHLASWYRRVPMWMRQYLVRRIVDGLPASDRKYGMSMLARRFFNAADQPWPRDHASWRLMLDDGYNRSLCCDDNSLALERSLSQYTATLDDAPPWLGVMGRMLHMDLTFHLPNDMLVKVDRMSMAHSLEVRVPFLGKKVIETCLSIPDRWKEPRNGVKSPLKEAMRWQLPKSILRRKKTGFLIPISNWLRTSWRENLRTCLTKRFCERTRFLRWEGVERALREHASGEKDHAYPLFTLLVLALWWERWLDGESSRVTHWKVDLESALPHFQIRRLSSPLPSVVREGTSEATR
jgi:asparagine synthase (glutamine-hydrolysing)